MKHQYITCVSLAINPRYSLHKRCRLDETRDVANTNKTEPTTKTGKTGGAEANLISYPNYPGWFCSLVLSKVAIARLIAVDIHYLNTVELRNNVPQWCIFLAVTSSLASPGKASIWSNAVGFPLLHPLLYTAIWYPNPHLQQVLTSFVNFHEPWPGLTRELAT